VDYKETETVALRKTSILMTKEYWSFLFTTAIEAEEM